MFAAFSIDPMPLPFLGFVCFVHVLHLVPQAREKVKLIFRAYLGQKSRNRIKEFQSQVNLHLKYRPSKFQFCGESSRSRGASAS